MITHAFDPRRRIPARGRVSFLSLAGGLIATLLVGSSGGCQTGEYAYVATIAGGEQLRIPLNKGGAVMAKEGSIQILHAGGDVEPNKHQFFYKFAFADSSGSELRSVLVEDVSDEKAVLLVEDLQPKLVERRWDATSRFFNRDDEPIKWVFYVGDSFRVFRFTVTFADGRKIVLHQGSRVPAWAKAGIRSIFGEKY
jgi:hypothetical protein